MDDQSVQKLGVYPWPRDVHARLIDALDLLEAKLIVFDIEFNDSSPLPESDARLAKAIQRSGKVILPIRFDFKGGFDPRVEQRLKDLQEILKGNPAADEFQLSEKIGIPISLIAPDLEKIRTRIFKEIALEAVFEDPGISFEGFLNRLGTVDFREHPHTWRGLESAYYHALSYYHVLQKQAKLPRVKCRPLRLKPTDIVLPYHLFSEGAIGFGFTNDFKDVDRVLRRTPLYIRDRFGIP